MPGKIRDTYYALLKTWLDALIPYQVEKPSFAALDGGILCPACSMMHGRSSEAVYPLLCMADLSGEERYLAAARKLIRWQGYMICDDGSFYNDSQSEWNGITVFAALSMLKSLKYHSRLLNEKEIETLRTRLMRACAWIKKNIVPECRLNINYVCAGAAALASAGVCFSDDDFISSARALAELALGCISENGLLCGEGTPVGRVTARGVRPVDVCYNVEESLPCLYEYACAVNDEGFKERVTRIADAHLKLMLPDGAWDNSFGTRNFKWTYWGGRTSDGCQAMMNAMGRQNPVYAEAALRNLELMQRATAGLLFGGMDYAAHGEQPCTHHALCHAKVLAQVLDEGVCEFERTSLPSDTASSPLFYRELNTLRAARGKWRMTVCGGDFEYMRGGCASGGVITLLWCAGYGAVIASANTDYSLKEAHNQQLSRLKAEHRCVCARLDSGDTSQMYDYGAQIEYETAEDAVTVRVRGSFADQSHAHPLTDAVYALEYTLADSALTVRAHVQNNACRFVLPLVCPWEGVKREGDRRAVFRKNGTALLLTAAVPIVSVEKIFNLAPGFCCAEVVMAPDETHDIAFTLSLAP